jgi:methyl-accepting chemotaxis protein
MEEKNHRTNRFNSLSTQIILWVGGCSLAVFVVVFLCMQYYDLPSFPLAAAVICLLVLLILCWHIVAYHLRPLGLLADSAQRMAEGHLDERVPDSGHKDEIGQLQNNFVAMQHSLSDYISDMQQKREMLSQQNEKLQAAYEQAKEADLVKERFLNNMTEQMTRSVGSITTLTETICNDFKDLSRADLAKHQIQILNDTETVTLLLNKMLSAT